MRVHHRSYVQATGRQFHGRKLQPAFSIQKRPQKMRIAVQKATNHWIDYTGVYCAIALMAIISYLWITHNGS